MQKFYFDRKMCLAERLRKYVGLEVNDSKRLRELKSENNNLKSCYLQ